MHTCAAHPVDILLVVVGRVIIDHQDQLLYVQAACGYTSCNEQATDVSLEVIDGGLSVALVLAAMQRQAWVANLQQTDTITKASRKLKHPKRLV